MLLLLALHDLPPDAPTESTRYRRYRDAGLAILAGTRVTALTWGILTRPPQSGLADYLLATSLPGGGGANVVNVILVDFRGFDTLGEITVLVIAALGITALLTGRLPVSTALVLPVVRVEPLLLRVGAPLLLALTLLLAAYIFFRGHHLPGGGFIAGLVTTLGLATQYLTGDFHGTTVRLNLDYQRIMGGGLALVALTGLVSTLFGYPLLTSAFAHIHLPILGDVEIASAMAFDLGVYLVVVGAVMQMLLELGQSEAAEGR
jgi:multicomponent K+:H+ antiporter subunit A